MAKAQERIDAEEVLDHFRVKKDRKRAVIYPKNSIENTCSCCFPPSQYIKNQQGEKKLFAKCLNQCNSE